jgi:ubiquinone/menaquinone biosynthesis C-methylase UbiE
VKRRRFAVLIVAGLIAALTLPVRAEAQNEFAVDAERLAKALQLAAGQTVADIGAGSGELAVELARVVGPTGRLYATELGSDKIRAIRRAADKAELKNVTVVEAHATRSNLQDRCCDALVMRLVYHHIKNPVLMNQSLYNSLKPGGRLAIIDFPPDGEESADPSGRADSGHHGVTSRTVTRELRQAGFELVSVDEGSGSRRYMVVMRRP